MSPSSYFVRKSGFLSRPFMSGILTRPGSGSRRLARLASSCLFWAALFWVGAAAWTSTRAETASGPSIAGCKVYSSRNIWNARVDSLPVHARSGDYVQTIGSDKPLHPDFGAGVWPPGSDSPMGIPFIVVPGSQPLVPVSFTYPDESDPGPYPIPADAPIEGGANSTGDRHVLVLESGSCVLYETYYSFPQGGGTSWKADSGAVFDLKSDTLRPAGWTSADAAGLPILPGLVRYEEVAAGAIRHAIRFTAPQTQRAYVWPARHFASQLTGINYPPMGMRFRLKADFDISEYAPQAQIILKALKEYGMILADNGSSWYINGAPDPRWDNDVLDQLKRVKGSDFEAVSVSSLMEDYNSGRVVGVAQIVYPQLAVGGGFTGILMAVNLGTEVWNGTALLDGGDWPDDRRWSLDGIERTGETGFPISLQPGATGRYVLDGIDGLSAGWLALQGLGGSEVDQVGTAFFFQFWSQGSLIDSTGVPPVPASKAVRFPVERGSKTSTGIAIRHVDSPAQLSLYDQNGDLVQQEVLSQDGALLCEEIFDQMPAEFVGSATVASTTEFHLVVLRQEIVQWDPLQFQLTTIPATPTP